MSVLRSIESKIAGLVEGTFSRAFKSEVRPVEIARKLAREMEEHKSLSVSRSYVPNEYLVFLSPRDRERFADYEDALTSELAGYLLEHARRENLALMSRPVVEFETDDRLGLGEFGIQTQGGQPRAPGSLTARGARGPVGPDDDLQHRRSRGRAAGRARAGSTGHCPAAHRRQASRDWLRRGDHGPQPAMRSDARRPQRLRTHAEVRARGGSWVLTDLGSTNGTRLNGRRVEGSEVLKPGDKIELGASQITFELE